LAIIGGIGARPFINSTIAAAAALPCWLAMWPDFGIAGAGCVASPITCTFFTLIDSVLTQSTSHQRFVGGDQPRVAGDVSRPLRQDQVQHATLTVSPRWWSAPCP